LEFMTISFALELHDACRPMWSLPAPTACDENCSKEEAPSVFESDGTPPRSMQVSPPLA
jgi:hypothetical protein